MDEVDCALRRSDAALGLFLKGMQNIDHIAELYRVNRAIRILVVTVNDLHDLRSAKGFEGFGCRVSFTHLRRIERLADIVTDLSRKAFEVSS
jgi:hypothetical protein